MEFIMDNRHLRHISRTNVIDSPLLDDVRRTKLQHQENLPTMERQLQAAHTLVKMLKNQIDITKAGIALCRSIDIPIRRLPTEILSQIFSISCSGDIFIYSRLRSVAESYAYASDSDSVSSPDSDDSDDYWGLAAPIRRPTSHALIRVCKYWRNTAIQTPSVWKQFVIVNDIPWKPYDGSRRLGQLLDLYGNRLSHFGIKTTIAKNPNVFQIITRHFNSITSLSLSSSLSEVAGRNFALAALQELRLSDNESRSISHTPVTFDVPSLKKLYIYRRRPANLNDILLPWKELEFLSIGSKEGAHRAHFNFSPQDFTQIFSQLTNLTYLHLSHVCIEDTEPHSADFKIILPELRVLELHSANIAAGQSVLNVISAPTLEEFDLVFFGRKYDEKLSAAISSIKHFLETCSPHLRRIRAVWCPSTWVSRMRGSPRRRKSGLHRVDIFALCGNAAFFRGIGGTTDNDNVRFLPHAQVKAGPFARWPNDVMSLERFVDRFLENGRKPYVDVPRENVGEEGGGPGYRIRQDQDINGLSRIVNSVFRDILGVSVEGVPNGERRAYLMGRFTVDRLTKYSRS